MHGLATIADAGYPLIVGTGFLLLTEEWHAAVFGLVLLGFMVARFTWMRRRIDGYYALRYGRVVAMTMVPGVALALCIVISYAQILRDLHAPVMLQMTLMTVGLCSYPLWTVIRDFPHRAYWLLLVATGLACVAQLPFYQSHDLMYVWARNTYLATGCALVAVGALDHRLLSRTLHVQPIRQTAEDEPANPGT
jgi:hypothetical protein